MVKTRTSKPTYRIVVLPICYFMVYGGLGNLYARFLLYRIQFSLIDKQHLGIQVMCLAFPF